MAADAPAQHLGQAFAHFQAGRHDEALAAVERCLALDAGLAVAYQLLGMVLAETGQPAYAARAFEAALTLAPDEPALRAGLDVCRARPDGPALDPAQAARFERLLGYLWPSVSACLIVKNEAADLPRCLASIRQWVNEIVVVDTGSSDASVAIAETYGASVHHFAWCDDFSAARNASLEHATGEWILVIDADEQLVVEDEAAFRQALRQRTRGGYMLEQRNLTSDGEVLKNPMLRLFRRDARVRYRGRLHESVTGAIEALEWPIAVLAGVALAHDGYLREKSERQDKARRNRRIAAADAAARPQSAEAFYNLGSAHLLAPMDPEAALTAFARVEALLAAGETLPEGPYVNYVTLHGKLLVAVGRAAEAEALYDRALALYPGHAELLCERGRSRAARGDAAGAQADFEASQAEPARLSYARPADGSG